MTGSTASVLTTVARLKLAERGKKTVKVPWRLVVNDVQVQRQDGRAFELRGHSSDDQKVNAMAEQDSQESEESNASRLVHL